MKDHLAKVYKQLLTLFWINILIAIFGLLLILYILGPGLGQIESSIVFERYSIIFTLIGIPLALKLFHAQYKKLQESSEGDKSKKYLHISVIRILILDAIVAVNITGLYIYEGKNFIYMCIITIFAFMFTFPGKVQIDELDNKILTNNTNIE